MEPNICSNHLEGNLVPAGVALALLVFNIPNPYTFHISKY